MAKAQKHSYFPFFPNDFEGGTKFFSNAQCGAYWRLLIDQWNLEILTEKHFSFHLKEFSEEEMEEIRAKFDRVSTKNGAGFQNEKMENVRKYVKKISKIRSESGKLGVEARIKQMDNQMDNQMVDQSGTKTRAKSGILNLKEENLKEENLKSKIKNSLSAGKKSTKKPPSFPWPEDFVLTIHLMDYATKQGIPDPVEEFENFRLNAISKSYVYADWSAAWMKWCRDDRTNKKPKEEDYV